MASGVTNKLHYLVIGDEGSPLYGHGKKGSKQVKAEELNAAGANIKIISETAFLQMLAGQVQEVSHDAALAGCERLWQMAIAPGPADAPLAQFAIKYIRRHHPDIALAETDRPVDPGAEIPAGFLDVRAGQAAVLREPQAAPRLRAGAGPLGVRPLVAAGRGAGPPGGEPARRRAPVRGGGPPGRRRARAPPLPDRPRDARPRPRSTASASRPTSRRAPWAWSSSGARRGSGCPRSCSG